MAILLTRTCIIHLRDASVPLEQEQRENERMTARLQAWKQAAMEQGGLRRQSASTTDDL